MPMKRRSWRAHGDSVFEGQARRGAYDSHSRRYEVPVKAVIDYSKPAATSTNRASACGASASRLPIRARHRLRESASRLHRRSAARSSSRRPGTRCPGDAMRRSKAEPRQSDEEPTARISKPVAGRRGGENHRADLHRQRPARRLVPAADAEGLAREWMGPAELDDRRGRQPHRQQSRLPLSFAERGLA